MKKILSFLLIISMFSVNIVFAETIDITNTEVQELHTLINTCKDMGINPEYEIASYNVLKWYVSNGFMAQDVEKMNECEDTPDYLCGSGCTEEECELRDIIAFNREKLYEIYSTTKAALQSYANGTAASKSVGPEYDFSSTYIDGRILKDKNGKAIFSVGYARNNTTDWDVEELGKMGATNVVEERGITSVYTTNVAKDWMTWKYATGSGYGYSKVANGNNFSIRVTKGSSGQFYLEQEVEVEPNNYYELSFALRGTSIGETHICAYDAKTRALIGREKVTSGTISAGSTNYTLRFKPKVSLIAVEFQIPSDSAANELFIDGASLVKDETSTNILSNPNFTQNADSNINVIWLRKITSHLKNAKDSNTMLSLIISPHIFPTLSGYENDATLYAINNDGSYKTNEYIKFNINHPKAREVVEDYLRNIGKMIRDDENASYLSNIILTNESAFDVTNFQSFYLDDFKQYVRAGYNNDITKVNMNWGTNYSSFDDISNMRNWCGADGKNHYDTIKFNEKVFTEWHSWMASVLKEYIPNVKINAKPMKYFDIETVPYWELGKGTNIEKFDTFSDISGCDAYSFRKTNDISANTFTQKMMWYDFIYSLTGKPINDSENHIILEGDNTYSDRMRDIVFADLWQGALHGRAISSIWNFSVHDYNNLFDTDRTNNYLFATRPDCVNAVAKASLDLRRNSELIEKFNNRMADVAIFYSASSQMHTYDNSVYDSSPSNTGTEYLRQLFYAYKGAITTGQKVGFVTEDNPNKMNSYEVVIVPAAQHIRQKAFEALQTFINNGGKVIVANDCFKYNEFHRIKDRSLSGAITISASSAADYATAIRSNIDSYVEIKDASTGNYASDIDCSYFIENGRVYVSLINLSETDKQYRIYCDGDEITGGKDLISGDMKSNVITLSPYEPLLLKYSESQIADVRNVSSNNSGVITWETDDEDYYEGVSVYSVLSNNILRLDNALYFSYNGNVNETYEIVSNNGEKTVRITTGNADTFTLTEVPTGHSGSMKINVKNNLDSVVHGVVTMTERTAGGNIVKINSVEMSAYGKASRNIEFKISNPDDSVTIEVFDTSDMKKVLSNSITN